jgi:integrase
MRGIYKRGSVWWICYRVDGRRIREGIGTKKQAEDALTARKADILRGKFQLRSTRRITFGDMMAEYLAAKAAKRSLRRDRTSFKHLEAHFSGRVLSKITAADIDDYRARRLAEGTLITFTKKGRARTFTKRVSTATVNREGALLRHMLNLAVKSGYIDRNPFEALMQKRLDEPLKEKWIPTWPEAQRLMAHSACHLRPVLELAFGTGLRLSDILNLRWSALDLAGGVIALPSKKTNVYQVIPMTPRVKAALGALRVTNGSSPFVFPSPIIPERPISTIKTAFNAARRRAGLPRAFTFHSCRHWFGSELDNAGTPMGVTQKLLGHRNRATTERYLHADIESRRRAMAAIEKATAPEVATIWPQPAAESPQPIDYNADRN